MTAAADLLDLPWVEEIGNAEMLTWLREQGVEAPRRESITHIPGHLVVEGLRSGIGIGVASSAVVERDLRDGRLVALYAEPPCEDDARIGYWIVTRPGVLRPPLRAFVAWLRRHAPKPDA